MGRIQEEYFRQSVESATPTGRVVMLYKGALSLLEMSISNLKNKEFESFTLTNVRAQNILSELRRSLDLERGGEVARRMEAIYTYLLTKLTESNAKRSQEGIEHVVMLLTDLSEAWQEAAAMELAALEGAKEQITPA